MSSTSAQDGHIGASSYLPNESIRVHPEFNHTDSDITIQSSDQFQFKLHRKNLETHTRAFPGSEFSTNGEIVPLTEPAGVLEIVFQFVYPRKHPRLEEMNFFTLIAVAEAVEKYEVFSAMYNCEKVLMEKLNSPSYAVYVLNHAIRHHYPRMIIASVQHLARKPVLSIVNKLPVSSIFPWLRYQREWDSVFEKAIGDVTKLVVINNTCNKQAGQACYNCRSFLFARILEFKRIDTVSDLTSALDNTCVPGNLPQVNICGTSQCSSGMCCHLSSIVAVIKGGITAILPFTEFLKYYTPDINDE